MDMLAAVLIPLVRRVRAVAAASLRWVSDLYTVWEHCNSQFVPKAMPG
jgi:hypothetical protein